MNLIYYPDDRPGITRRKCGRGFSFFDCDGVRISDGAERARLKALAVPPAYDQVWMSPHPNGHLQATGRDAKQRKQYRYHPDWRKVRNRTKFDRLIPFGYARPLIRQVTDRHLRQRTLSREKLLALVVRLLDSTLIRVGNDEYVQQNESFGLTTLRERHVDLATTKVSFHFSGKSGVEHEVELSDRRLVRAIKRCQELPGQRLFRYVDEAGEVRDIDSADVNDYLQTITGEAFTSKDFRTWAGTACTAQVLNELGEADAKEQRQENIRTAIREAAQHLGNRVPTCRNFYVHPTIPQAYEEGWLLEVWQEGRSRSPSPLVKQLTPSEQSLITVLEQGTQS